MSGEERKSEWSVQQTRLVEALRARDELQQGIRKVNEEIRRLGRHSRVLVDMLRIRDGKMEIDVERYGEVYGASPWQGRSIVHVPGERYHLAIYNIGRIPTPSMKPFYSQKNVYPIDYVCKRAYYRGGAGVSGAADAVLYTCAIRSVCNKPLFEISSEDMCIRGRAGEVFNAFRSVFGREVGFGNLGEFFGLSNPWVRRLMSEQSGFWQLGVGERWSREV